MRDKVLVCRDNALAGPHRRAYILVRGAQTAHDLDHRVDLLIVYNSRDILYRAAAQLGLIPAHQNILQLNILSRVADLQNAAAHNAAAKKRNLHFITAFACIVFAVKTFVFDMRTI